MAGAFGAFGKMPALGDFFRLEVAPGFVTAWDGWLQNAILAARDRLGDAWHDCYMSAPIWRFTLSPGLAGGNPTIGVLMPSVDRVGRQFPLTLVATLQTGMDPIAAHFAAVPLFQELESLALDALDDMARDALAERLGQIVWHFEAEPDRVELSPGRAVVSGSSPGGALPALAARSLARDFRAPSVWSAETDAGPRLMVLEGLPDESASVGLFDLSAAIWQKREAA
ncbi:type VI secretion system-associated protein TagF [Defluviimonas sp. WL0002]|uniref:Type VI secretion system-associated protein TagF n=1 Tax=Albidovulum marisflavi TaxID=2984159 RepID=A0ABT2ZDK5_9RHOB|nr:type VI secretion system-associated protein TagF [Defluviimonas sp. WL0002]MCV2869186.1 type VI secretion system-associated protein TagF [Defluviimonas sp. WL0002]